MKKFYNMFKNKLHSSKILFTRNDCDNNSIFKYGIKIYYDSLNQRNLIRE